MLSAFLLMFAIVFFISAGAAPVPEPWKSRLVCFGLACITGAMLLTHPMVAGWVR